MANLDAAFGFRPCRHNSGGVVRPSYYPIASAYATDIFEGDPVKSDGAGGIAIGTAGGDILGVMAGVEYIDNDGEPQWRPYWPASTVATDIVAKVYDDPQIVFRGQLSGTLAAADLGQLADLLSGAGNTQTGQSGWEVGAFAGGETQVRLLRLFEIAGNALGANAIVEFMIGEHELLANTVNLGLTEV